MFKKKFIIPISIAVLLIGILIGIKIKDAVSIFFSFFNCRITYNFSGESRKGDPIRWVADIDKLKSFGYIPSVDLRSGLQQYFEWVKVNKKI